ncbi:4-hydroxy-tetrahydrodipicolinate synthase [Paramicrobacterium humi]|uniref:4-hydroxy-tetrahydrodipicolinate synthase n=1 Tax=Paramicrobacterium humi TaxID=640635 RepID=A0A1H4L1H7_9MICO|nr:dihydrodipicolinate synthase family protein [Microbacterium humi]SEB64591.1 4-hydroxy-tetrahydrodipicolinate synthase [Microbacterium humi]
MSQPDIITALPIAFDKDGALNLDGTREIFRKTAGSGVQGGLVLGTTGEFVSLGFEERGRIVKAAVEELAGMRCIIHVGAASLYEVLQLIDQARAAGVTEIAVITPYYLPVTDAEMVRFFTAVSDASAGLDVYIYVFQARTGNTVTADAMATISRLPNIVGAKVSGEPLSRLAEYRAVVPDEFIIYTGSDRDIARVAEYGAQGVISGIASTLPVPFTDIAAKIGAGETDLADAQAAVDDAVDTVQGDMARMKAALRMQGVHAGWPRMALQEPNEQELADLERAVREYDRFAPAD